MQDFSNDDAAIAAVLQTTRTIAMLGASADPARPSHGVMRYLLDAGYDVIPVTPKSELIHGRQPVPDLAAAAAAHPEGIDIVDVFRRSDALPAIVDEALAVHAGILWTQLGVVDEPALEHAVVQGLGVVADRCIKVEHARLLGGGADA